MLRDRFARINYLSLDRIDMSDKSSAFSHANELIAEIPEITAEWVEVMIEDTELYISKGILSAQHIADEINKKIRE